MAQRRQKLLANDSGRSLLEVIVVMAIASILAAAAINRFNGNAAAFEQRSAVDVIVNDLRYAQEMALNAGRAVKVDIQPGENQYSLMWDATGTSLPKPYGGGAFVRKFGTGAFGSVRITGTDLQQGSLTFAASGVPYAGGTQLSARKLVMSVNNASFIYVYPVSGKVEISNQ